jgi:catechol 2,3-dioxygenase-like lactoylglutathione lyase family enzyme
MNTASEPGIYNAAMLTIVVRDVEEAVQFYTSSVGFTLKSRYGNEFAVVQGPGITIGLHPGSDEQSGRISIGLSVDSLEESMQSATARGVNFSGDIVEDPPMRFAFFRDPNGVELYLAQESEWR